MNTFELCKFVILNKQSKLFHISEALEVLRLIAKDLDYEHQQEAKILEYIAQKRLDNQHFDVIIQDVVSVNPELIKDIEQINSTENEEIDVKFSQLKIIKSNLQLKMLLKNSITKLSDLELSEHTSTTEMLNSFKKIISDTFEKLATLDTVSDESELVIDTDVDIESQLKEKQPELNVSTGYENLDELILGYRSSRLYIYTGGTGKGKSLLLNNATYQLAINFKNSDFAKEFQAKYPDRKPMILFVTNENTIEETVKRLVAIINDESPTDVKYDDREFIVNSLNRFIQETGVSIVIKYVPPRTTTSFDIYSLALNYERKYGFKTFALIVDYLDRLLPLKPSKEERLSLGYITDELKAIAIKLNVPVLTASQLNREGYKSDSPDLTNIGESWKKVENADVVLVFNSMEDVATGEVTYEISAQKVRYYKPSTEPTTLCRPYSSLRLREQCANQNTISTPNNELVMPFSPSTDSIFNTPF